ncbi:NAD-dependent epimerase/dehydratase family protein [Nocardia jejuensis]|uniref:NAD-dependent epimerase/dehydratase family protein n=1 Tax=Nocardia jejuensis TaxID=328049 RepID=UPI0008334FBD|nr:NAD-dependent epimerase/dehydratase family protein [Nocardia jejuensis]
MRVLVTGAGGYLGRAVVAALGSAGHDVVAMVHTPGAPIPGAAEVRVADVLEAGALRRAMEGVDAVAHLAGLARARESLTEPLRYFRVNTSGTIGVLEAMAAAGVTRLAFASTAAIYASSPDRALTEDAPDAPPHPYAASKLAAELAVEAEAGATGLSATVIRLLNLTGGTGANPSGLVPRTLDAVVTGTPLTINGDGTAIRDYLHVADAATAFVAALDRTTSGATRYNIGSGTGTSILDVVAAVERVTGRRVPIRHNPPVPESAALVCDPAKARRELSWTPAHSDLDRIIAEAWQAMSRQP